jgi:hypothetical protein
MGEDVSTPTSCEEKSQEPLPSSMTAIAAGLILPLIGSVLSSNWARDTLINYVGFGMVLAGISIFVFGIVGTATKTLKACLDKKTPAGSKVNTAGLLNRRICSRRRDCSGAYWLYSGQLLPERDTDELCRLWIAAGWNRFSCFRCIRDG